MAGLYCLDFYRCWRFWDTQKPLVGLIYAVTNSRNLLGYLIDHINNCIHHITKHVHGVDELKTLSPRAVVAENKTNVCTSPACIDYVNRIKSSLAKNYTKLDPCQDFNMYACQGWIDNHDYRADQSCTFCLLPQNVHVTFLLG